MGGISGEVRGKSKIEVYLKYEEKIQEIGEMFQEIDPYPRNKKQCKKQMIWDPEAGKWVLYYHLHT